MSDLLGKVPGGTLLSTMAELRSRIEQTVMASPQRLTLAKAYLDSLEWGIRGLAAMGQRVGFMMLEEPPPAEYPKMLYRGENYQIAENPGQEELMISAGFSPRVPLRLQMPAPPEAPAAPTFSVTLPERVNEPEPDTESVDD